MQRHGVEGGFCDEAECALAANHEVGEYLNGRFVVNEGVEAVAHGVFDAVLTCDFSAELRGGEDLLPECRERVPELGVCGAKPVVSVFGAGVDNGAAREDDDRGAQGLVGVLACAAGHARRVVGYDAADGAGDLAGRVRPEFAAVA
ncbi:hypothetical protein ACW0JT_18715 [Arthrobacter sp. SA17]